MTVAIQQHVNTDATGISERIIRQTYLVIRHLLHVEMSGVVHCHSCVAVINGMRRRPRIYNFLETVDLFRAALIYSKSHAFSYSQSQGQIYVT